MVDVAEIPVIDVSALATSSFDDAIGEDVLKAAQEIHRACVDVGFFYISEHGISTDLQARLFTVSKQFFELPLEEKQKIRMELAGRAWRGFFKLGGELTSGRPDQKEGIYLGIEHSPDHPEVLKQSPMHGQNLWPDIDGFKETILEYIDVVVKLAHNLMRGVAIGLGLPHTYFHERFTNDPTVLFRVFNYPVHVWTAEQDEWGVREHTDMGFLTILKQDDSGGLEVRNRAGRWIEAPPKDNTFVVNIGDQLEVWTHGLYKATLHRVRNKGNHDRLSFPLFFDPNWNASLDAIPIELLPQDQLQQSKEVDSAAGSIGRRNWDGLDLKEVANQTYGEFVWAKISRVFPELASLPPRASNVD